MADKNKSFAHKISSFLAHWFVPRRSNNQRPKILHPDSLFVISLIAIGIYALVQTMRFFPSLQYSILGFSSDITVEKVIAETNQEREKAGLNSLHLNQQLSAAALAKAQDMLNDQYWSHVSPDGDEPWDFIKQSGYTYRVAGENLARDFHHASDMIDAWMNSPSHRANILNGNYDEIGIAVVKGKLEGFETVLVVQMFGTPQTATAAIGDAAVQTEAELNRSQQSADQYQSVADDSQESKQAGVSPDRVIQGQPDKPTTQSVLSQALVPEGGLYHESLFSPLQLTKAAFLGLIMIIIITLVYDSLVIGHRKTMRIVGNNLGHIILFSGIAFLMILFKGGVVK